MTIRRFRSLPVALFCALILLVSTSAFAGHSEKTPNKQAIVLAAFGTSYPEALKSILNIKDKVEKAFPTIPVKLAFTSNIIRRKWNKRLTDTGWQQEHPDIPTEIMQVRTPLATIADLQNDGYRDIVVQSLHVFAGEEFEDLKNMMISLASIRTVKSKSMPFNHLRLGRPALGMPGDSYPYTDDMTIAVQALSADVQEAKALGAALVYMGHGNDFFSTGIYAELQRRMNDAYDIPVFAACVEGYPSFEDILTGLEKSGVHKILLKPLMIVAGDHASNDMAGDDDDSWKVMLTKAGYDVKPVLRGLGSLDSWADLYVMHLKQTFEQHHLLR